MGSPKTVRERLERYAEVNGVDEFLCVSITCDFEARQRSYALPNTALEDDSQG
jgi:hypothetical protein